MKVLAIIPARGGSKGIPGKNLRPVGGRPLVEHVIKAAREARRVGRVVVSTDAPDIGAVAMAAGAEVVWRPADISGDLASSEAALLHVLDTLRETESFVPDVVVFLQCTSPLTQPEDIDATIEAMEREAADCALTVAPFHHFLWRTDPKRAPWASIMTRRVGQCANRGKVNSWRPGPCTSCARRDCWRIGIGFSGG